MTATVQPQAARPASRGAQIRVIGPRGPAYWCPGSRIRGRGVDRPGSGGPAAARAGRRSSWPHGRPAVADSFWPRLGRLGAGRGAAGTAVVGMVALGESVSALKLVSIGLVLAGVIGLNLSGVTP